MLEFQMNQHIMIVDNLVKEDETNKPILQIKARDQVYQSLQEQIKIRDDLLQLAGKHFIDNNVKVNLQDPRLINIENIAKIDISLPQIKIPNNIYSPDPKVNNRKFKSNNLSLKKKIQSRLSGNSSLPPISSGRRAEFGGFYSNKRMPGLIKASNPYGRESSNKW